MFWVQRGSDLVTVLDQYRESISTKGRFVDETPEDGGSQCFLKEGESVSDGLGTRKPYLLYKDSP